MTKSRSQIALEALDEIARRCELRWGPGRLPKLVPAEWAAKFHGQAGKLNAACEVGAEEQIEEHATRMAAAWNKLDGLAEAAGADPISPKRIEGRLPDGRLLIVVDGPESAWRVANDDRMATVWSIDELVRVLWNFEMVNDSKMVFPGARVEEVRVDPERVKPPVNWKIGDDLPQSLLGAG